MNVNFPLYGLALFANDVGNILHDRGWSNEQINILLDEYQQEVIELFREALARRRGLLDRGERPSTPTPSPLKSDVDRLVAGTVHVTKRLRTTINFADLVGFVVKVNNELVTRKTNFGDIIRLVDENGSEIEEWLHEGASPEEVASTLLGARKPAIFN